jgi:DNA replication protein DnaC
MKSTSEILASMGIEVQPPADAAPMVKALGFDLDDDETVVYSSEVRLMAEEEDACRTCKGLESCQLTPAGFQHVYRRTPAGHPSFSIRACDKRVQYEGLVRNERLLASCRIPESLRFKSFKGFDSTENGEAVRAAAQVLRDPRHKGVVFYGPTGVGKTHLAAAILNNRILAGKSGIYATVPELMDSLRSAMRTNTIDEARQSIIDIDLLFLDDLGAENPTEFVVEELFKLINGRLLHAKQTIGTSNLSPDGFRERYAGAGGERIVSRLYELCAWVEMTGRDRRL